MNTPPEDKNIFKEAEAAFRRPLHRFIWFVWLMTAVIFAQSVFLRHAALPRPARLVMIIATTVILLFGGIGFFWWLVPQHPLVKQMRPAPRRFGKRVAFAMLLYFAVFEAATWYYEAMHPAGFAAVLMALAPSVPLLFAIRAMMLFLKEESDEFLRSRTLEGWAIATGLTLAICTVWGFLDQFEVVPHLPLWAAFLIWACCLVPVQFLLQQRDA